MKQSLAQKGQQDRGDKGKECHTPYFVEFLDEEDNKDPPNSIKPSIQQEEEAQLIVGWNKSLSLKRSRNAIVTADEGMSQDGQKGNAQKRQKMLQWKIGAVIEGTLDDLYPILMGDKLWNMAEEAGQNLPHPHQ
ncbi:kinase [Sesbania bispinosa]|nr:kinase [Sesbania bispinosa]